ncbi:MAG: TIGR02757 family protein [Chitinophagaceae bacterium]
MFNPSLIEFFDSKVKQYNQPTFIKEDPISIPHLFSKQQDIEIAAFFAAILAWGNRTSIINSCKRLMQLMHQQPYQFILDLNFKKQSTIQPLLAFVHRTFNATDLLHILTFLQYHYGEKNESSLETAFSKGLANNDENIEGALNYFHHYVFSNVVLEDFPERTKKHIAAPFKKSACKRLNMFLRWMVRDNTTGVDFGLWKQLKPTQLVCPLDVHVSRVAKRFNLLQRNQNDWQAAVELTSYLKRLDANDPVKYDFALFGLGVIEKF